MNPRFLILVSFRVLFFRCPGFFLSLGFRFIFLRHFFLGLGNSRILFFLFSGVLLRYLIRQSLDRLRDLGRDLIDGGLQALDLLGQSL